MAKKTYEKMPHAKMLLVALRSVGYTNETAIADIVDNSISGSATEIELYFDWDNRRIVIADNGFGMDYQQLMDAMEIGSADPNEMRPSEDLGRFGLGMKTAAFSMAKNLLVISKKNSVISNAEWNLDTVAAEDKWEIVEYDKAEISEILESINTYTQYNKWKQGKYVWEQRKNISGNYMFYLNKKHPMLLKLLTQMNEDMQKELKTYLSLVENYSPIMLSGIIEKDNDIVVSAEDKQKDILVIQEKIRIYRMLQYDDSEIYDTLYDSPEYLYLREDLKKIIEGTR